MLARRLNKFNLSNKNDGLTFHVRKAQKNIFAQDCVGPKSNDLVVKPRAGIAVASLHRQDDLQLLNARSLNQSSTPVSSHL